MKWLRRRRRLPQIDVIRVQRGDVIVVRPAERVTQGQAEEMKLIVRAHFPDNDVMVVPASVGLVVARTAP